MPGPSTRRLVCIVEGEGEVEAIPNLCNRIRESLEAWDWIVDKAPMRQPRARLVDRAGRANVDGVNKIVALARRTRSADAVLLLCDADDDCPATWGPSAESLVQEVIAGACVMAVREYEAWLLASHLDADAIGSRPIETIRDAKGRLKSTLPGGYRPSLDQLAATRTIDVTRLRTLAPSFDKLVRSLERLFAPRR